MSELENGKMSDGAIAIHGIKMSGERIWKKEQMPRSGYKVCKVRFMCYNSMVHILINTVLNGKMFPEGQETICHFSRLVTSG